MLKIIPVMSGSSGNALMVVSEKAKILIDAGGTTKTIKTVLARENLGLQDITHILITHTHRDHVAALPVLLKYTGAKLLLSKNALGELEDCGERAESFEENTVCEALDMEFKAFKTPHDSFGSVGFVLSDGKKRFAYCTDLGYVTEEVKNAVEGCDAVYIESNHDVEMLKSGPYPYFLKQRILSPNGHLSNRDCGKFISHLAQSGTEKFVLAHLSEKNNTPSKALLETGKALLECGAEGHIDIKVAQKKNTSGFTLTV